MIKSCRADPLAVPILSRGRDVVALLGVPGAHGPWAMGHGGQRQARAGVRPLIFVCSVRSAIFSIICGAHATHNYSGRAAGGYGANTNTLNTIFPFKKRQRKCLKVFCWNCPVDPLANHTDCWSVFMWFTGRYIHMSTSCFKQEEKKGKKTDEMVTVVDRVQVKNMFPGWFLGC